MYLFISLAIDLLIYFLLFLMHFFKIIYLFIHSSNCLLIYVFIYFLMYFYWFIDLLCCWFIYLFIYSFTQLLIHLCIISFTHLFIELMIHLLIYWFIDLFLLYIYIYIFHIFIYWPNKSNNVVVKSKIVSRGVWQKRLVTTWSSVEGSGLWVEDPRGGTWVAEWLGLC